MARIVPALGAALGSRAAGRRRALRGRRSGRLGPRQHGLVRLADGQARGRPARPGHAARRRPGQGDHGARQSLGHDPPARAPARVHGLARPRPVRPRAAVGRGGARPAPVRRGEHPGDGPRPGRADRPVPDLDRPPRDDPRLRVRGASLAPAVPRRAARAPADAVRPGRARARPRGAPRPRPVDPRRGRRRALARAADGSRAEGALPRDPGRDEPARRVQRLRHGRGRPGPRARASSGSASGSTSAGPSARRSSGRCSG